jgi:hypothetical protein
MNNEIRKLIDDNWEDIKELIAQKTEAEQKPKTIWDLDTVNRVEEYYYITEDGKIKTTHFDRFIDEKNRILGNAFLTKVEAEFELERRKLEAIMRKYSRPFKNGECNYMVVCDTEDNMTFIRVAQFHYLGGPVFASEEIAQKVIDEIGEERLIKYWFGVTE